MILLLICLLIVEFSSIIPDCFLPQCQAAIYLAISVFHNIMACRVFRLLRLVDPTDSSALTTDHPLSEIDFSHTTRSETAWYPIWIRWTSGNGWLYTVSSPTIPSRTIWCSLSYFSDIATFSFDSCCISWPQAWLRHDSYHVTQRQCQIQCDPTPYIQIVMH